MAQLSLDERVDLICRRLQEVIGDDNLKKDAMKKIMAERPLRIYWGTAPTGAPHIGYFVPILKIADFLQAGCEVTILLADLHASLDALKSTFDLIESRTNYYQAVITAMLEAVDVSTSRLKFVRGSEYQLRPDVTLDLYKLMAITTFKKASKASADVVKQAASNNDEGGPNCLLSGLAYPLLQALDEVYLDADVQFGGIDQRKIFIYAEEFLKKLDPKKKRDKTAGSNIHTKRYHRRIHLCNPMVPSLSGGQMSSSSNDKISILASPETVEKVIRKAFCADGVIEENGLLAFCEYVLVPWRQLTAPGEPAFEIEEGTKRMRFESFQGLQNALADQKVTPQGLKTAVAKNVNLLLQPIRNDTAKLERLTLLHDTAYPESRIETKRKRNSLISAPSRLEKVAASPIQHSFWEMAVIITTAGLVGAAVGIALTRRR